jgi:hypothetical protein
VQCRGTRLLFKGRATPLKIYSFYVFFVIFVAKNSLPLFLWVRVLFG